MAHAARAPTLTSTNRSGQRPARSQFCFRRRGFLDMGLAADSYAETAETWFPVFGVSSSRNSGPAEHPETVEIVDKAVRAARRGIGRATCC